MQIPLWIVREDAQTAHHRAQFMDTPDAATLVNMQDWLVRFSDVVGTHWGMATSKQRPPDDFDPFVVKLPRERWDPPDYIDFGGFPLVSRRFRDAVGAVPDTIQYLPVTVLEGGKSALAQDYRLLNTLAAQPALDLVHSKQGRPERMRIGGRTFYAPRLVDSYLLLPNIVPATEIFHESQIPGISIATDAFAERVIKAGCTGIEFRDPATFLVLNGTLRYRTADGIAERWLG